MSLTFHPYNRWCAIMVDKIPIGYMTHMSGKAGIAMTTLHLKHDAPAWMRIVRDAGPYASHSACQNALKMAWMANNVLPGILPEVPENNVLQFPVRP